MNRPSVIDRPRTVSHEGSVPTTVVVQLVDPATRFSSTVAGATASMSGATTFDESAAASPTVRVDAEPKPPRMPELEVVLPGVTVSRFEPRAEICGSDLLLRAFAQADGEDHRGDPDHDAEHGQAGPQAVGDDRLDAGPEGLEEFVHAHRALGRAPSRI